MSATDLQTVPPSQLFQSNLVSMNAPVPEAKIDNNLNGTFDRMMANKGIESGAPIEVVASAGIQGKGPIATVGTGVVVDRALMAGESLRSPAPVSLQNNSSDLATLGSQTAQMAMETMNRTMEYGSELLGRIFGGGDDPAQAQQDAQIAEIEEQLTLKQPAAAGPNAFTLG